MTAKFSVKKPYTVFVGVILVIVLGVVSLMKMTTDLLPDMSLQYALIITTDVGASPEEVESDVTAPIEGAIATTSNIKNVNSISYNSYSIVTCEYEQNANMDSVVIEIQQKLDQLRSGWSDSVGSPMIMQLNPDMLPIMMAAVDMDNMDVEEITYYVENSLIPALESVEGVASVSANGALKQHIQVTLDQSKIDDLNAKIIKDINKKFDDAQKKLDDGKEELEKGQSAMNGAGDQLSSAFNQVTGQRETINQAKKQLKEQMTMLQTQKEALTAAQNGLASFMTSPSYTLLEGLDRAVSVLDNQIAQLEDSERDAIDATELLERLQNAGLDTSIMESVIAQINAGIAGSGVNEVAAGTLRSIRDTLGAQLDTANAQIAEQFGQMSEMGVEVKTYKDLGNAQAALSGVITQINTGIAAIEAGLDQVDAGNTALSDAVGMINNQAAIAAMQVGPAAAQMAIAQAGLEQAQSSLDSSKDTALEQANVNNILTMDTLAGLLVAQNFDMPAGYVSGGEEQYLVRVGEAVEDLESLQDLVLIDLGMDSVGAIRLSDVATVEMKDNSAETYAIVNGNPGIILSMEKQTGYSTGDVTDRLLERFDLLEEQEAGLHLSVLMDQGVYIDLVVSSLLENMLIGGVLAVLILLLFLKDFMPTLVIACSIPLSVIFAIVLMYFTGITLNTISMSGLVLGIGMLVDNSIVVIENIYRLRSMGYSVRKAAVEGASQVTGAIIASTLTTVSVYAPIIFTDGITRQLFIDLALTVAFTLVASLLVAMTFVPMMSSVILRKTKDIKHPWFDKFQNWYGRMLEVCLKYKVVVFVVAVVLLLVSGWASLSKGLGFIDMDMVTNQLSVTIGPKEDQTLEFEELTALSDEVISRISDIEGIDTIGASAGGGGTQSLMGGGSSSSVSMYILLDEDNKVPAEQITAEIEERTKDMDCVVSANSSGMQMGSMFGSGLSIRILGRDIDTLQDLATQVAKIVEDTEGTVKVKDGLDKQTPQFTITVDKEKAAKYGYTVAQVFQLVYADIASTRSATTIRTDIRDYEVFIQTEKQSEISLDDIKGITFKWKDKNDPEAEEQEIPLTDICKMEETTTLSTINRSGQNRYLQVSAGIDKDHNVTLVSSEIQKKLDLMQVPEGYEIKMTGEDETINDSMRQLLLMLLLAVIFIYLIMVAQFQSLLAPFIIMFTIPLAFTGGFIALYATNTVVNVLAMLGFIMLAGVIVNNGIVLIDYINQRRREGLSKKDAIVEAGITRLRPILMTALTTILAMSTTAVGLGSGSEMIQPMAITIVGGLVYGTVLTLIVIPCVYDVFHREKSMVEEEL